VSHRINIWIAVQEIVRHPYIVKVRVDNAVTSICKVPYTREQYAAVMVERIVTRLIDYLNAYAARNVSGCGTMEIGVADIVALGLICPRSCCSNKVQPHTLYIIFGGDAKIRIVFIVKRGVTWHHIGDHRRTVGQLLDVDRKQFSLLKVVPYGSRAMGTKRWNG